MRICVLGNSHAGCINLGWQRCKSRSPEINLTFFASPGGLGGLNALSLEGTTLQPKSDPLRESLRFTSGGLTAVDLLAFDAFLLIGLGFSIPDIGIGLSESVVKATLADSYLCSNSFRLASYIRGVTRVPVFVFHTPQPAFRPSSARDEGLLAYDSVFKQLVSDPLNMSLSFLQQPHETFADTWFTQRHLSVGSRKLNIGDADSQVEHDEKDSIHMNADFGEIVIKHFLTQL